MSTPSSDKAKDTRKRLDRCWERDLTWDEKYPTTLKDGCSQIAKAMSVPPAAILGGLLILTSFVISPAVVTVPGTDWVEPTLIWLTISMPTGSRKTTVYQFLKGLLQDIRQEAKCKDTEPTWLLMDATFEKMGALMAENGGRLLGMFDKLSAFLIKIKLYSSRGLSDSHELAMFLELYNSNPWTRTTVTGEANFSMQRTSLTVGGFNQPSVARSLIELPGNAEKGLSQRFLWLFPKPVYSAFDSLEPIDKEFTGKLVTTLAKLWRKATGHGMVEKRIFSLPSQDSEDSIFRKKYDAIQNQLQIIAGMDDLLSGTLSKSLGQIIRVSAAMHVLFHMDNELPLPDEVSKAAIEAAIDFVEVCCQHTAYITGRGDINQELEHLESGTAAAPITSGSSSLSNEAFVFQLPGKTLDVSLLVNAKKKFRNRGGKEGAMKAMKQLEENGLGRLVVKKSKGSLKTWNFVKAEIPGADDRDGRSKLATSLKRYGLSLLEYIKSFHLEEDNASILGKHDIDKNNASISKRGACTPKRGAVGTPKRGGEGSTPKCGAGGTPKRGGQITPKALDM